MSFNSVYTQIWRVLLHLAADPYPDASDLAMKVLNSIAYKVGYKISMGVHNIQYMAKSTHLNTIWS